MKQIITIKKLIISTLLLLLVIGCKPENKNTDAADSTKTPTKAPVAVEAMKISKKEMSYRVTASSNAYGKREGFVYSETSGKVTSVYFNLGDYVKKGQRLVAVESSLSFANLEQAKALLASTTLTYEATKHLYEKGNASETEMKGVELQFQQAKTSLTSATKQFNDCIIRAPFSGYIATKDMNLDVGAMMSPGAIVTKIVDIRNLKATFHISENELSYIEKGLKVDLNISSINKQVEGKIVAISPAADPMTGSFAVRVEFKNTKAKDIKSGMTVSLSMNSLSNEMVYVVPINLIQDFEGKKGFYVSNNSRSSIKTVETLRNIGNLVEVTGVDGSELIVSSGYTTIESGDSLIVSVIGKTGDEK